MQHRRCGFAERAIVPFFGNPDTIPRTSQSISFTSFIQTNEENRMDLPYSSAQIHPCASKWKLHHR